MRKKVVYFLSGILAIILSVSASNPGTASLPINDSLFKSDSGLQLTIFTDLSKLLANINYDTTLHSGKLWYVEKGGSKKEFDILIKQK